MQTREKRGWRYLVVYSMILLTGCGTLPNGHRWGQDTTLSPGWQRVGTAARKAALSPQVWVPAVGAGVFLLGEQIAHIDTLPWPEVSRTALQASMIGLTIGTAWARVEAKQHFPSDVLFGAALGNFFGAFMNEAFLGLDGRVTIQPSREGVVLGLRWPW